MRETGDSESKCENVQTFNITSPGAIREKRKTTGVGADNITLLSSLYHPHERLLLAPSRPLSLQQFRTSMLSLWLVTGVGTALSPETRQALARASGW